jgi:hypothetical protein
VLAHAEDFLAGAEPTDGARIFILSDGELDNDDLADFDALLAGLDPRIQIATMTLGHGAPDDKMARLSKGGGGPARTLTDPSQLFHFDPGVDSERALLLAADCPPADPVLGKTFSGKECPGVYGFNNLRRRADTAASLSVPLSGGERAALVTFQTRRKGRVVVVGMDLHGQWSGPLFASQQAVPFVEQLIINTRRRPEQARRFALLFARRGLDDSVLLSLKTPTDRVGPFRLRFQAADADTDLDERRPHPLGFVESGLFELELSAGEVARDTRALDAAIYDNRDQPLEQARVWIENAVQRPERPQRPNLDLVVSLNQQTDTRHMRYLSEPDIVISPEMLDRLRAGGLDPVIVSYLERESGRYFPDLDDLYRQVGAILRKETGRHSLTDDERTALADLVQGLRTMPFEAPRPDVQWRSLYESPWRFALLPGLFGLMLLTNRARLRSWASGLPAQGRGQP